MGIGCKVSRVMLGDWKGKVKRFRETDQGFATASQRG